MMDTAHDIAMTHIQTPHTQRGFTLLLASLIASIVLAIGTSIFGLAQKSVELSSISRDSQLAFYAADTGAECALYWDYRWQYFGQITQTIGPPSPICNGVPVTITGSPPGSPTLGNPPYPYDITFQFNSDDGYCSSVEVNKKQVSGAIHTTITGNGFNTDCASITSSRALQRSVTLTY